MKSKGIPHQYACFLCRKCFKRPQFAGAFSHFMTAEQQKAQADTAKQFEQHREYKCPDCGGAAVFMGTDFKAPKKSDVKSWHDAQIFIETGKVYYRGVE
ncbi:hypothetical protein [Rheinheimera baltica]|uniref:hypothetical protein n=1 Tax=Rheinheimera baltica TaxID=67576 RepID=UPI0027401776|nr:hypothetical protein [Rheinheimera baltica]MDP5191177.1 hypothetical protein [Rheinheimera baltica]